MATTLAPETTQAAPPKENGLVDGVELRGLEPLTPTLPGRHDQVRGGSPQFHKRYDQRMNTAVHGYESPWIRPTATRTATKNALR